MKPPPDPRTGNGEVALLRRLVALVKYPGLWITLGALGAALGFGVITPKRTADEVRAEMRAANESTAVRGARADMLMQLRIDSIDALRRDLVHQHQSLDAALGALVRMECVNPMVKQSDKILSGIVDSRGFCIK